MSEAYVTLATTDGYGVGALVLAHSLLSHNTTKQLCILVTPGVSQVVRDALARVYNNVVTVDVMDSNDSAHLALLDRPELGVTFTKLHCWTLTQYSKCVFLDADILALQNTDELFNEPELSAACDVGWPDCFNSGMFVFVPSQDTYERLLQMARTTGSFDGGDQGILNSFFPNWKRLSFVYNMVASATYSYLPAFKQFGKNVKLVHFLGATKPWHGESADYGTPGTSTYTTFVGTWWTIYRTLVHPTLPEAAPSSSSSASTSSTQQFIPPTPPPAIQQLPEETKSSDYSSSEHRQEPQDSNGSVHEVNQHHHQATEALVHNVPETHSQVSDDHSLSGCSHQHEPEKSHEPEEPVQYDSEDQALDTGHDQNFEHEQPCQDECKSESGRTSPELVIPPEVLFRDSYSATGQPLIIVDPFPVSQDDPNRQPTAKNLAEMYKSRMEAQATQEEPKKFTDENLDSNQAACSSPSSSSSSSSSPSPSPPSASFDDDDDDDVSEELISQQLAGLSLGESVSEGRRRWESGRPDYMGKDSFDNILAYIDSRVNQ